LSWAVENIQLRKLLFPSQVIKSIISLVNKMVMNYIGDNAISLRMLNVLEYFIGRLHLSAVDTFVDVATKY